MRKESDCKFFTRVASDRTRSSHTVWSEALYTEPVWYIEQTAHKNAIVAILENTYLNN